MDILDNLIQTAQIAGSINIQCQFQGQWYVEHQPQQNQGIVHIVTQGSGYLRIGQETKLMQRGDIIFFPRSQAHTFSHDRLFSSSSPLINAQQNGAFELKHTATTGEADLSLFCATFHYAHQAELIFNLPDVLFLHIDSVDLNALLQLLTRETLEFSTGSKSIIDSLATVLLVKMIRTYLKQEDVQLTGTLNGLQDRRLSPLIQAIVNHPEQDWSIEKMLNLAHLSRAQFMRIFKQKIAISPHAFVMKRRLEKAAMYLNQSAESILNIALATGFQSETHFGKAFKAKYGIQPSLYRKQKLLQK